LDFIITDGILPAAGSGPGQVAAAAADASWMATAWRRSLNLSARGQRLAKRLALSSIAVMLAGPHRWKLGP